LGLELEIGWLPPLINQSTNPKIQVGAPGYLDASRFARILEIPTGQVTRARATCIRGQSSLLAGPGKRLAHRQALQTSLARWVPADAAYFAQRFTDFAQRLKQADQRWLAEMKPYEGRKIVTYTVLAEFAEHFHLNVVVTSSRALAFREPQHTSS